MSLKMLLSGLNDLILEQRVPRTRPSPLPIPLAASSLTGISNYLMNALLQGPEAIWHLFMSLQPLDNDGPGPDETGVQRSHCTVASCPLPGPVLLGPRKEVDVDTDTEERPLGDGWVPCGETAPRGGDGHRSQLPEEEMDTGQRRIFSLGPPRGSVTGLENNGSFQKIKRNSSKETEWR